MRSIVQEERKLILFQDGKRINPMAIALLKSVVKGSVFYGLERCLIYAGLFACQL